MQLESSTMARKQTHLFEQIASFDGLHSAAMRAVRGKRAKPGAAAFLAGLERQLLRLRDQLSAQTWRPGAHLDFVVRDPKRRVVSAAPFRDRVVHHALHAVIAPVFERGFIADSYANRVGFGTHRALTRYEEFRDKYRFVLRADVWRYFPSIDHAVLKADLRRRLACPETLWLCDTIIDAVSPASLQTERADAWFEGDDLLTPLERARGLPLGNLTSQFFANVFLDPLDHYCKEVLRAPYVRYVDDLALFSNDLGQLQAWRAAMVQHLARRRLRLHPEKTMISGCAEPAAFLGYVTSPGRRQLVPANVGRFAQRLHAMREAFRRGELSRQQVQQRVQAWVAHARHADTWRLRQQLFAGGWFDPLWANGQPVEAPSP